METWKLVPSKYDPRYEVSDQGKVRRLKDGKELTVTITMNYRVVSLWYAGCRTQKPVRISKLVIETFTSNPPFKYRVAYRNDNPLDDRLENIYAVPMSDAMVATDVNEEWRAIPHLFGLFEAGSYGNIRKATTKSILTPTRVGKARVYLQVTLGDKERAFVHRLVCCAFHGECPGDNYEVDHKDDNPSNCRADNLQWLTKSDNVKKSYLNVNRENDPERVSPALMAATIALCAAGVSINRASRIVGLPYSTTHSIYMLKHQNAQTMSDHMALTPIAAERCTS